MAQKATEGFLRWAIANRVGGVGTHDSLVAMYHSEDERGLVCCERIHDKQVIISVPTRIAIKDYEDAPIDHLVYAGAPWSVRLAAQLVALRKEEKEKCPWAPYLAVLPEMVPSPLTTFSWEATQAIQYPAMDVDLNELIWITSNAKQQMCKSGKLKTEEDMELLEWAMSVVHSRTFATAAKGGGIGVRMLVPVIDMLNHSGDEARGPPGQQKIIATENVEWKLRAPDPGDDTNNWHMNLVALRNIQEGEELVLSYGERSNDDFLLHYGFVPARNPHDDYVLFEDWDEAENWLREGSLLHGDDIAHARIVVDTVYREVDPGILHYPTARQRSRLRLKRGGNVDPRLLTGFTAAFRNSTQDRAHAIDFVRKRCRNLLQDYPTSLVEDLEYLTFAAKEMDQGHGFRELLDYYRGLGGSDPVLLPQQGRSNGEWLKGRAELDLGVHKAIVYRAYKKMLLADCLFKPVL